MKVMISVDISDEHVGVIESVCDGLEAVVARSRDEQMAQVPDADIVLGGINRDLFLKAEKLKWVQLPSAGADGLMFPEFVQSDVILTSMKGHVGILI